MNVEINNLCKITPNRDTDDKFLRFRRAWYENEHLLEGTYNDLHASVCKLKYFKALKWSSTNWAKEIFRNKSRLNLIAE